jgi:hypothetical protein
MKIWFLHTSAWIRSIPGLLPFSVIFCTHYSFIYLINCNLIIKLITNYIFFNTIIFNSSRIIVYNSNLAKFENNFSTCLKLYLNCQL